MNVQITHLNFVNFILCVHAQLLSCVPLFVSLWTVVWHVPPSMEFSMQEYCSRLPFPTPEDLPDPGIEPVSLVSPVLTGFILRNCQFIYEFYIIYLTHKLYNSKTDPILGNVQCWISDYMLEAILLLNLTRWRLFD